VREKKKLSSKETGLQIALLLGRYFLRTEHLHYGYWTDDLTVDLLNLPKAQENHSEFIISHIPERAKNVLDVGCGVGTFALKLTNLGYQVDCVSPSLVLTKHATNVLGGRSRISQCRYEELETDNRYDVILFSESFQYVNMKKALEKSHRFLADGGHLLICDFFRTEAEGESALRGGHRLVDFYDLIAQSPFNCIEDIDITTQTAPSVRLVDEFLTDVGLPVWSLIMQFLSSNYPLISKFLQWKYRKKIERVNRKYFSGTRNAENFVRFKSYRLLLYSKVSR
jgi:ubiquinone/menaquinone biosynthesis C-methylase UbiE